MGWDNATLGKASLATQTYKQEWSFLFGKKENPYPCGKGKFKVLTNAAVPVLEHVGYGFKAASCYPLGACVTPVHGPVHEVTLVRVELQEQHDCLTA